MRTIALATQKGGSGKSTLAIGLAVAALQQGERVLILETDRQGTVSSWLARRPKPEPAIVRPSRGFEVEQSLSCFADEGYTLAIIDTPGGADNASTAVAVRAADLCLLPARPTVADIEATQPTLSLIRRLEKPFAIVLNQTAARYQPTEAATLLSQMGVLALPYIALRNDHQSALKMGLGVCEFAPRGKAAEEILGLWGWINDKLDEIGAVRDARVFEPAVDQPGPERPAVACVVAQNEAHAAAA